ncbi:MAG: DUF3291 domain-containing protein [Candidatus Latescibacteria bacterium]|nr:DUF3291 domain-containing protein [Candidatus Latescibacterota bacterium]
MARIAFYTFGILRQPYGHQQVQGFFDRVEAAWAQAEQAEGFIDRDRGEWGDRLSPRFYDEDKHAGAPATLSLWTDLESVSAFAYRAAHGEAFRKRRDWFVKPEWPTYVAWWVDDDHTPTREEACQRQEYLHDHGPSAHAFNFKQPFDEQGNRRN